MCRGIFHRILSASIIMGKTRLLRQELVKAFCTESMAQGMKVWDFSVRPVNICCPAQAFIHIYPVIIRLLVSTGMGISEALHLKPGDVDIDIGILKGSEPAGKPVFPERRYNLSL